MIKKLEIKLVDSIETISIKAILIFVILNFLIAGFSYFFLDFQSKKNAIWTKQIKLNIPRYTVIRNSEYIVRHHDILPRDLLLEKITQSRFEGNLRSICNIKGGLFDDHVYYKWMKSSTSRIGYSVVLNIRHNDNKSVNDCGEAYKKLFYKSYDIEKNLYIALLKDLISRDKLDLKRYEKEYEDLLQINNLDARDEIKDILKTDSEIVKSYNLSLFSLMSENKRNFDRLNQKLSKIDYEISVVNKNLQIQIEYENIVKSYKPFLPIVILINVIFSFLLIFIFLLLKLRNRTNQ